MCYAYVFDYQPVTEMVFVYPSPLAFYRKITQVSAFFWFCQKLWGFPGRNCPDHLQK